MGAISCVSMMYGAPIPRRIPRRGVLYTRSVLSAPRLAAGAELGGCASSSRLNRRPVPTRWRDRHDRARPEPVQHDNPAQKPEPWMPSDRSRPPSRCRRSPGRQARQSCAGVDRRGRIRGAPGAPPRAPAGRPARRSERRRPPVGNSAPTTIFGWPDRRVADEPRVGVLRRAGVRIVGEAVSTSSAVPVLPATVTPGIAASTPVPNCTTATIICCTSPATCRLVTCTKWGRWCACTVGIGRRPPIAIVAATSVISSALACTLPWPIADEPTAS